MRASADVSKPPKPSAFIEGWQGLGDTIYLRPALRKLAERYDLHVSTPWPQLLEDLDLKLIRPAGELLRTQGENVARDGFAWGQVRETAIVLQPAVYWPSPYLGIPESVAMSLGQDPAQLVFDLPKFPRPACAPDAPYAVVRPATVRREWANPARNPDPRYIAAAAAALQDRGLKVVSVAHLQEGEEWALKPLPPADVTLHAGELTITELLGLTQHATVAVGGVGWLIAACPAQRVPCVGIGGGHGYYNAPERVVAPPMDASRIRFILPRNYCRFCHDMNHACDKEISDFPGQFAAALQELRVGPQARNPLA